MRFRHRLLLSALILFFPNILAAQEVPVSEATQECLDCHAVFHPGIVEGWKKSRHAAITPAEAMQADDLALKVSSKDIPEALQKVAVGCAECHNLRPDAHTGTFEHNGYDVHTVVSPDDCRTCHAVEADQYSRNIMAHAYANLADNKVYNQLEHSILGHRTREKGQLKIEAPDADTRAEACYYCHGTVLKVSGTEVRDTDAGELEFPVIEGWPNQGVGRINLDGSKGACSACHTRHSFSIEVARKPYTCKECHVGPDVPAFKVYSASKHGNIYSSKKQEWDFKAVPWTIGQDFTAPTCAACHVSLLVNTDEEVVNERTHEMKNRLSWRIFGLIYAHPQPRSPDTTIIRNKDGLPLPTDFEGGFADKYLLTPEEQATNTETMQATCLACHGTSWVEGHFRRYHNTIKRTNTETLTITKMMQEAWERGYAQGLDQGANPFDEAVERQWSDAWLFYANTVRFASAMAGGGDYGVFADGRYQLSKSAIDLHDWLEQRKAFEELKAGKN
ncbi:MAG: multiheme c-type cytochrome [Desulfobacterales bacterium]|nr:multiheme c-type cytochrome [Desulfobacterales bacterium]